MASTTLIMIIFLIAVSISSHSYFWHLPQRVILSVKLLMMGGPTARF